MGNKKVSVTEMAEVAVCQRRVYLKARLGERITQRQAADRIRGQEIHDRAFKQSRPDDKRQDKRCFVATAVYGQSAWQTDLLRDFRDTKLMPSAIGRLAVKLYYRTSPTLVRACARLPWLKSAARKVLDAIIRRLQK